MIYKFKIKWKWPQLKTKNKFKNEFSRYIQEFKIKIEFKRLSYQLANKNLKFKKENSNEDWKLKKNYNKMKVENLIPIKYWNLKKIAKKTENWKSIEIWIMKKIITTMEI